MRFYVLCCLAVLTLLSNENARAAISVQERAGLLALYNATGGNAAAADYKIATQSVYRGANNASSVLLPIAP